MGAKHNVTLELVKMQNNWLALVKDTAEKGLNKTAAENGTGEGRFAVSPDKNLEKKNINSGINAINWLIEQSKNLIIPKN